MKKLRGRRRLAVALLVAAMGLLLIAPAGAIAEGAETPGETTSATESPPPSTGWVPQGGASEGSGGGSSGTQQGSSLGSGGSSRPEAPPPSEPVGHDPAPGAGAGAFDRLLRIGSDAAAGSPGTVVTPAPEPEPAPAKPAPEPPAPVDTHVGLGKADALLTGSSGVKGVSTSSAPRPPRARPPRSRPAPAVPWIALIVFGLILVVAGTRLVYGPIEADSLRYSRFKLVRRAAPRP